MKSKEKDKEKNSSNGRERKDMPGEKVSVTQDTPLSGAKSSAASSDGKPTETGASGGRNQQSVLRRCWKCKKESNTLKACNRCHTALYCNKDCQRLHLKAHEDFCLQYHYKNLPVSQILTTRSLPGSPGLEDFENSTENGLEIKECSSCKKKSDTLKKCGRCHSAAYCNKDCQRVDYKAHKDFCRRKFRFEEAKSKIYPYVTARLEARNISLETEFDNIRNEFAASLIGIPSALLVEITGPYFHFFRYGIEFQDINGDRSFALFYTQTDHYPMPRARSTMAVPLPECLKPGTFLLIMEPVFHFFADGTVGFRFDSIDEVHFIKIE